MIKDPYLYMIFLNRIASRGLQLRLRPSVGKHATLYDATIQANAV